MNQSTVHRDLDVQFGGDVSAMVAELQECFAQRLGISWTFHPEEVQALLNKFSAQTMLQAMTDLRADLHAKRENPASYIQEELLMALEEKAISVQMKEVKAYELY